MTITTARRLMVQLQLVSDNRHLVAWVQDDPRLKVDKLISLKDHAEPSRLWRVTAVGSAQPATAIKRGWHNNI